MKIIGFTPLHYGKDFLKSSLESVKDIVDRYVIIYTQHPSYGFGTESVCPDSEEELRSIAEGVLGSKLEWHSYPRFNHEGQHREKIYKFTSPNDLIIATDSDEIWDNPSGAIEKALEIEAYAFRIEGFVNFWKNLDHVVIDGFQPVRIYRPKFARNTSETIQSKIYHLGYMISEGAMRYKLEIHGHRNDIDQVHGSPENYFNKWKSWTSIGCGVNLLHPASRDIWQDAERYMGIKPKL